MPSSLIYHSKFLRMSCIRVCNLIRIDTIGDIKCTWNIIALGLFCKYLSNKAK